jgi:electron transfer flavoprotein alpha/beta subunit
MRVLICVKPIYDPRLPLAVNGQQVMPDGCPAVYSLSPASSTALEWGLHLQRAGESHVTALSAGGQEAEVILRSSLGIGVDCAVHLVPGENAALDPWTTAAYVKHEVWSRSIDLVLCGDGAFGPFLAEALDWPQITRVVHLEVSEKGDIRARRLLERGGREETAGSVPAVITFNPTGCETTYISQLRLQQASRQPIERTICQAAPPAFAGLTPVEVSPPKARPRRMAAPAAGMSAAQRMRFMMGGGQAKGAAGDNRLIEGDAEQAAEKILQFLKERGFV